MLEKTSHLTSFSDDFSISIDYLLLTTANGGNINNLYLILMKRAKSKI
jgi:hypothetical protein|tara:strand:- start:57 stop:200 length:144 start_codon:yes stop_codon:yes gene_type:complete